MQDTVLCHNSKSKIISEEQLTEYPGDYLGLNLLEEVWTIMKRNRDDSLTIKKLQSDVVF